MTDDSLFLQAKQDGTAWSKGTGFGGTAGKISTASIAKAEQREQAVCMRTKEKQKQKQKKKKKKKKTEKKKKKKK